MTEEKDRDELQQDNNHEDDSNTDEPENNSNEDVIGSVWEVVKKSAAATSPLLLEAFFKQLRMAAEHGNADAQFCLAYEYRAGEMVKQDTQQEIMWGLRAAEQGHASAQYNLAISYVEAGLPENLVEAVRWCMRLAENRKANNDLLERESDLLVYLMNYQMEESGWSGKVKKYFRADKNVFRGTSIIWEAAEKGDADMQCLRGQLLMSANEYSEALKWFRRAAEQGHAGAQNSVGVRYLKGQGVEQDYVEANKWFKLAAEQGEANAQLSLGVHFLEGQGIEQDNKQANHWLRKAAEQGNAKAQCELSRSYCEGRGLVKDYNEGAMWLRKAAEQGHEPAIRILPYIEEDIKMLAQVPALTESAENGDVEAQFKLGSIYLDGVIVPKDLTEAVIWIRDAAENGHARAQVRLGMMYDMGTGVPEDDAEAIRWYRLAAEQGDTEGQRLLGTMYQDGNCVDQDLNEAARWYRLSAEQGSADAQYCLANLFLGKGNPENDKEGVYWLEKAAAQGLESANRLLNIINEHGVSNIIISGKTDNSHIDLNLQTKKT